MNEFYRAILGQNYLISQNLHKGIYVDNAYNRMLKRVGMTYGKDVSEEIKEWRRIGTEDLYKDSFPELKVIATGSSSFELANKINEPLTGRKWEFNMWPISIEEMISHHFFSRNHGYWSIDSFLDGIRK